MSLVFVTFAWWRNGERQLNRAAQGKNEHPDGWEVRVYEKQTRFGPERHLISVGPFVSRKLAKRWARVDLPQHEPLLRLGWNPPPISGAMEFSSERDRHVLVHPKQFPAVVKRTQ